MVVNQDTCQLRYKSWILSAPFVYKQFQSRKKVCKVLQLNLQRQSLPMALAMKVTPHGSNLKPSN